MFQYCLLFSLFFLGGLYCSAYARLFNSWKKKGRIMSAMPNVWIHTRWLPCQICEFTLDTCHAKGVDSHQTPAMPNMWILTGCLAWQMCGFTLDACPAKCVHSHWTSAMPSVWIHTQCLSCQMCKFTCHLPHELWSSHTAFTATTQNCPVRLFHKCKTTQTSSTELRKC